MHELERRWHAFVEPFRAGDDAGSLLALQQWIEEWDRCFWAADFSAFPAIYDPEFRTVSRARLPVGFDSATQVRGPAGFEALRADAIDAASRFWFDIQEFVRGSPDRFAGLGRFRARGRYTGLVLAIPFAVVWTLRGDKIVLAEAFMSHRHATASVLNG